MGNSCSAVCCGNDGNGEVNTNIAGKDRDLHNNNQYKMELMKNIHLVIKLQAWARGNKARRQIARQLNEYDANMRHQN